MNYLLLFSSEIILFLLFLLMPHASYAQTDIVINELLVHPQSGAKEWVELHFPADSDCIGYVLDDDEDFLNDIGNSKKYVIETVVQGADNTYGVVELSSSMFNNAGDSIYLFNKEGIIIDHFTYNEDPGIDISFGRYPDKVGNFFILAENTKGSINSLPYPSTTPTPKPTEKIVPSPTLKPTPTSKIANAISPILLTTPLQSTSKTYSSVKSNQNTTKIATNGSYPTVILPTKIISKELKIIPTQRILVKGSAKTPGILIALSGLAFIGCAILYVLRR